MQTQLDTALLVDFGPQNEIDALRRKLANLVAACKPVASAIVGREEVDQLCWNPRAPMTLAVTVAQARGLLAAIDNANSMS